MITIPFANALGPNGGPQGDGVIYGVLPRVTPVTALSTVHLAPFTKVYRGNADAAGAVTWSNITTQANDDTAGDVSLFDTAAPTADRWCVELDTGDELEGVSFLVATAAVIAGTPVAIVRYKGYSAEGQTVWKTAQAVTTPSLTSTGIKTIGFTALKYSDLAATDDVLNPTSNPQQHCLFVEFSGITGVTTAPAVTRVWKKIKHSDVSESHKSQNFTSLVSQGANPDFSSAQSSVVPISGDLSLFGFDEKPARLFPTVYRPSDVAHSKEWVYSTATGFSVLPAAAFTDPSTRLEAALSPNPTAHQLINLTSTYASGTWGSSGIASTETLAGDGYLEFKVGANPALAGMVGFSLTNANAHYTSIGWAIHVGHGATAFASQWASGVQQSGGARAIVTGDVLRLERRSGVFRIYQNGVFQHQFTAQSTAAVLVDMAFIFLCGITDFVLVNTAVVPEVPVTVTWKDNVLVTVANGGTKAFGVTTSHQIPLAPPADWAKQSLTDTADVAHDRYWIGLRTRQDVTGPILPANFTLRAQPIKGTGVQGIAAPETTSYERATVAARDPSLSESVLLIVNGSTGQAAEVRVPANAAIATSAISPAFAVTEGDQILLVQARGDAAVNLADGALWLS